jgi:hypothetical protein
VAFAATTIVSGSRSAATICSKGNRKKRMSQHPDLFRIEKEGRKSDKTLTIAKGTSSAGSELVSEKVRLGFSLTPY